MRSDKLEAKKHGIPSSLRRYAKRYGQDIFTVIQTRLQNGDGKRVGERKNKAKAV